MRTREILFRGKRTDNGEWVEGDLNRCAVVGETHICRIADSLSTVAHRINPVTICTYTGLTDKNGRKIFEGDICEIHSSYICEEDGYFVVEWDEYCAKIILSGEDLEVDFDSFSGSDCKVVGNIYDNPELIDSGGKPE